MTIQFGRCNVCSTPCASCMSLVKELFRRGGTSNWPDESCEHDVNFEKGSETSAASSHKGEGGILDSNSNQSSSIEEASLCFSGQFCSSVTDQTASSSPIILVMPAKDHRQDVAKRRRTIKLVRAEDSSTAFVNCSLDDGGATTIELSNVDKPCQPSKFERCDDESAPVYDVKVCDICGDAGQDDFLAVCCKCKVSAEHVSNDLDIVSFISDSYCMRAMLATVPDSNWICEECMQSKDNDKLSETKFEMLVAYPNCEFVNQPTQGGQMSNASCFMELPDINTGELGADKSSGNESSSLESATRISGNVICSPVTKRIPLGAESGQWISGDSRKVQAPGFDMNPSHKLSLLIDYSSQTRSIQGTSAQDLPNHELLQMATGSLSKPKSFNDSGKRPKVQRLDVLPEKRRFSNRSRNQKKGSNIQKMWKSVPSGDKRWGSSNAVGPKFKRIPAKVSDNGSLKGLKCTKKLISVKMVSKTGFMRLQVGSTKEGTSVSASSHDKKFESHGECTLPDVYGTKDHNLNALQILEDTVTASKQKTPCLPVADMVEDVYFPSVSDAYQEEKQSGRTSNCSLESRSPCSCPDEIGGEKVTVPLTSSNVTQKAPETSPFISANECLSNGSGSEYYDRTGNLAHVSYCHLSECSPLSFLKTTREKDTYGSSQIDSGPSYCNEIDAKQELAVPLIDHIWKGECEIQNSWMLPGILYRIQAHLSTRSSFKVPEAVKMFSKKIALEEVSRLTAWPIQFQEYCPQDDSIGLYFFAQDIESYINYKSLLKYMVDCDMALMGNFNGIELFMFSSHLLPENSRYWNGLLYLWGVFRERKVK